MSPGETEWVELSAGRRAMYGLAACLLFLVVVVIAWVDFQAKKSGMCDMAIIGGAIGGGIFLAYFAILGREQRRIKV